MNIPALNALVQGGGTAPAGQHPSTAQAGRARESATVATATTSAPQDVRQRPQDARPVLDMSDTALTKRDIPRGSIIDIIA